MPEEIQKLNTRVERMAELMMLMLRVGRFNKDTVDYIESELQGLFDGGLYAG